MSKSPAAPLSIPGVPKKGDALPVVASFEEPPPPGPPIPLLVPAPAVTPSPDSVAEPPVSRLPSRVQATIAVTVRLDERRYERMKSWGMTRRVTNQEVIVAALDRFFHLSDDEREEAIASVRRQ